MQMRANTFRHNRLTVFLATALLGCAARAHAKPWERYELDARGPGGMQIVAVHAAPDSPVVAALGGAGSTALSDAAPRTDDTISPNTGVTAAVETAVPLAGFIPYVAVGMTDRALSGEFEFEHVVTSSLTGNALNPPMSDNYVVAVCDTGATQHVIGDADRTTLGLTGPWITGNLIPLGGASGEIIYADVSERLGVFATGLESIDDSSGVLDTSGMVGHWNVSVAAFPEGQCGGSIVFPTLIGTPLSGFFDIAIRNDIQVKRTVNGQTYIGPAVRVPDDNDPTAPSYVKTIPLDLRPLGVTTAAYYPDILNLDFETPWIPTALTTVAGDIPTGGWFYASVRLAEGASGELQREFMLDLGAQVCVMREFLAGQLGFDPNNPEFEVEVLTADCNISMAPGFTLDVLKIDGFGGPVVFEQVPIIASNVPSVEGGTLEGIIGTNVFHDRNLRIRPDVLFNASELDITDPLPPPTTVPADFDGDGDVDLEDYGTFLDCFNGPGQPIDAGTCAAADLDDDGDCDLADYGAFLDCFNGPANPPACTAPTCPTPPADTDGDGDVDLSDYSALLSCFNGPNAPYADPTANCDCLDQDSDGDVDLSDYSAFLSCFNGPNNPPACV
jgi:hypothetical protein